LTTDQQGKMTWTKKSLIIAGSIAVATVVIVAIGLGVGLHAAAQSNTNGGSGSSAGNSPQPGGAPNRTTPLKFIDSRGKSNPHLMAWTIDDGPRVLYNETAQVLAGLKTLGVTGTFFLAPASNGPYNLDQKCAAAAATVAAGHLVENHSWDHPDFLTLTDAEVIDQITRCETFIKQCTGHTATYFRPPYGNLSLEQAHLINGMGYTVVFWDIDSLDWEIGSPITQGITGDYSPLESSIMLTHDETSFNITNQEYALFKQVNPSAQFITIDQCYKTCNMNQCYDPANPPWMIAAWGTNLV